MKICSKCMAENAVDAKFCKLCSSPLQQGGGKTCPSGRHTMDPSWTECAYCKAESGAPAPPRPVANPLPPRPVPPGGSSARVHTVVEGGEGPGATPAPGGSKPQVRPPTYREDSPLPPRPAGARPFGSPPPPAAAPPSAPPPPLTPPGRRTVYGTPSPSLPSATKARKIVGVLVTYSWRPEGQVFEVREGRNLIGRDPSCDICVPEDETMSGTNSHITYRQSFSVGDMVSMMGTDLNGLPVEQFHNLETHSLVRAGSTHFTFIAVELRKPQATEA